MNGATIVPDDTVGEPGPASSSGDEKAIHEPQANSKFDNVLNAPRPGVNDALEPPIAHIAARSGRVKPNDVSTTSMPPSPATGPMAGLIAQDPLAVQEGCHACKSSKNELDEHILKRAAQMHDMLDVGDDAGIRHDYLTACNEIKYQCLTLNMDDGLCAALKRKTSDTELHARFDTMFESKVYIGSLGSTTCQIYPYTGGVKEGSYDTNHTLQLELGARFARKLDIDMSDMAPHVAKLLEPHWEKLKAAREAGAYGEGEGKVPLLLTNSVGFLLGNKEVLDLADIPDDLMGGEAAEAIAQIKNSGCCMYNVEREDDTFCVGNIRFMYLIKQIFSPFFDPVCIMNHRIFGKDSKTVPASYNTKWRISLGADLIALDERYSDGLVLIDYGGGKASGSATVFKANADDGGKGKEIKDEDWVKEGKLYPFPVQDDMLESDDASFTETSKKIQGILQVYRERTNLPVFVAQTGPMRKAWSIENHVCVCGHHHSLAGHPDRYRAESADLTVCGDASPTQNAEGEPSRDVVGEGAGADLRSVGSGGGGGGGGEEKSGGGDVGGGAIDGEVQVSE
eukprot:CAMPEP_0119475788 /NCGR_PEP_ID=MMETSP1344-20130328/6541_1 /TAXON_ID=236787 /ORGANISM="Florenciella parvula, Strain CCMP2471" /LENGTH=566 /DNA_ID=CAMNT_0007509395 /DNA_START=1145 /DNA_END=2845 /DNA_ORIENTATION=-